MLASSTTPRTLLVMLAGVAIVFFSAGYMFASPMSKYAHTSGMDATTSRHVIARVNPSTSHGDIVPNVLHYVFGLSSDFGGKPFGFLQFLAATSAIHVLKPTTIYLHHLYEPTGWYWDQVKDHFTLVKVRDVTEIYGNQVHHFAHKADIIRLEALRDHGGVYLDLDVVVIKDFSPFYKDAFTMGIENNVGLCNAIMISKPFSSFVTRWINKYKNFQDTAWNEHSVQLPMEMSKHHPEDITVLDGYTFFYPLYYERDFESVHGDGSKTKAHDFSHQFAYHMWETLGYEQYLKDLDPQVIYEKDSSFNRLARKYISQDVVGEFQTARAAGLV